MVHRSSTSALSGFDLVVPEQADTTMMDVFARNGFNVWTMDREGYGKWPRTRATSDIASGVEGVCARRCRCRRAGDGADAVPLHGRVVRRAAGPLLRDRRAGSCGAHGADGVDLYRQGLADAGQAGRASGVYKTHDRRLRDRAIIESIFTRSRPGTTDPAVGAAVANMELVHGDTVPTGAYDARRFH